MSAETLKEPMVVGIALEAVSQIIMIMEDAHGLLKIIVQRKVSKMTKFRDERAMKCPECGGFLMIKNSVIWNDIDGQYRPIEGRNECISLVGTCIDCSLNIPIKGILVVSKQSEVET